MERLLAWKTPYNGGGPFGILEEGVEPYTTWGYLD